MATVSLNVPDKLAEALADVPIEGDWTALSDSVAWTIEETADEVRGWAQGAGRDPAALRPLVDRLSLLAMAFEEGAAA